MKPQRGNCHVASSIKLRPSAKTTLRGAVGLCYTHRERRKKLECLLFEVCKKNKDREDVCGGVGCGGRAGKVYSGRE